MRLHARLNQEPVHAPVHLGRVLCVRPKEIGGAKEGVVGQNEALSGFSQILSGFSLEALATGIVTVPLGSSFGGRELLATS